MIDDGRVVTVEQLPGRFDQRIGDGFPGLAGSPLHAQGVHQRHQRRLAHIGHQGQLVNGIREGRRALPAQTVEEIQPGAAKISEITLRQPGSQSFRRRRLRGSLLRIAQHPVHFIAAFRDHFLNGRLHGLLPGLTGKHARHHLISAEQTRSIGVGSHIRQAHIGILIRHLREHLLVKRGLTVALAHLSN